MSEEAQNSQTNVNLGGAMGAQGARSFGQKKQGGKMGIVAALCAVLAIGGVGFGIYEMIERQNVDKEVSELKVKVSDADGTESEMETEEITVKKADGSTVTISDSAKPSAEDLSNYIYIAQWGLKIKAEGLGGVSYRFDQEAGYQSLALMGADCRSECHYTPKFAEPTGDSSYLGWISRYAEGEEFDCVASCDEKVFTLDGYDYYYAHPQQVMSTDKAEQEWEMRSVELIRQIVTNPENYSRI